MNRNAFLNKLAVGVEDGAFRKGVTQKALLAVVLFKGLKIENVKTTKITVDGLDGTVKLSKILSKWKFEAVMLAGVSFAGFNVIEPTVIHEQFGTPVIIISRTKPNNKAVKRALQQHFEDWQLRWKVFEKLGMIHKIAASPSESPVYVETVGVHVTCAGKLIRALSVYGRIPEPLRVARLIARGSS